MANGIRFGDLHSYEDMNLILSKVDLPPASVKTVYVDNPGGDGSWDLTEATGRVNYKDRTAKFTFSVLPQDDFEAKKTEISNLLNGRRFKITLDKDPDYYWDGRCTVSGYSANKKMRQIVVSATVAPYKLKQSQTKAAWTLSTTEKTYALNNGRKPVCPTITCTGQAKLIVDGKEFVFGAGTHKNLDFILEEGRTLVKASGSGNVSIVYQEGDL